MFSLVTQILNTYGRVCLLGARLGQNKRPHQQPYKTISVTTTAMDKVTNKLAKTRSTQLQLQLQCRARRGHGRCYRQSPGTTGLGTDFPPRTKRDWNSFPQETVQAPTLDTVITRCQASPSSGDNPSPHPPSLDTVITRCQASPSSGNN